MTLKLEGDLGILKMYFHTENEVARLRHVDLCMVLQVKLKKYENNSQGQKSRSNVINFQPVLAFTM